MIEIKNARSHDGSLTTHFIESSDDVTINADGLLLMPAIVDPHVHFRVPGNSHKEDWQTGAKAAIAGGVTTVFDMPNTSPSTVNRETLSSKRKLVQMQLKKSNIPLRYHFYLGASQNYIDEIEKCKNEIIGVKIFMGSSTGDLLVDDLTTLKKIFAACKKHNLPVAVHAENEAYILNKKLKINSSDYQDHSKIRDETAATIAIQTLIELCREHKVKVYILHVSTKQELELIQNAKKEGLPIYAEVTPHHLFLTEDLYENFQGKALVNPPLRKKDDTFALFDAIQKGVIDCIGSDHAPHTEKEKKLPFGKCPSGMPNIELTLALLINAYNEGRISLEKIVDLTSQNIHNIFDFSQSEDVVLVDVNLRKKITNEMLNTKVKWSCFENTYLTGWPVCTIVQGKVFKYD